MIEFANARKLHEENPDTFNRNLTHLAIGNYVKICHVNIEPPERFWILVTDIEGSVVTGIVYNNLFHSPLGHGDIVTVHTDNIYDAYAGIAGDGDESDNMQIVCETCA